MMNGRNHLIATFTIFSYLCYRGIIPWEILILTSLLNLIPDMDLKFSIFKHRNILFHSILIPCLVLFGGIQGDYPISILEITIILSVGLHCLQDISLPFEWDSENRRFGFRKRGGTYCVFILNGRLNYVLTTLWLFLNFIASVIIFCLYNLRGFIII